MHAYGRPCIAGSEVPSMLSQARAHPLPMACTALCPADADARRPALEAMKQAADLWQRLEQHADWWPGPLWPQVRLNSPALGSKPRGLAWPAHADSPSLSPPARCRGGGGWRVCCASSAAPF